MDERSNLVYILAGRRRCGKTTAALALAAAQKKRIIVVDTQKHPTYMALGYEVVESTTALLAHANTAVNIYVVVADTTKVITMLNARFANALVIFEDAGKYYPEQLKNGMPEKSMIVDCRKFNIDIIFMFHFLKEVPDYLVKNYDYIVLFKTGDSPNVKLHRFPNWESISAKMQKVRDSKDAHAREIILLDE